MGSARQYGQHTSGYLPGHRGEISGQECFTYPISMNGKVRANLAFALDMSEADVKAAVIANEVVQKWLNGGEPKKFIFVKGRIINVVI
jgi:leucyl-tRNA synthetase